MLELDIVSVKKEMNRRGAQREPFFFAINYNTTQGVVLAPQELEANGISVDFEGNLWGKIIDKPSISKNFTFEFIPPDYEEYLQAFNIVMKNLKAGNSYLTNLTFRHELKTDLSLEDIFARAKGRFKLLFQDKFTVFSPEPFIRTENGKIFTFPMKGTIDAALENAEAILLEDNKEAAEHATIVDLLRNDLNIVSTKVQVDSYRYLEKLNLGKSSLLQASSKISGHLPADFFNNIGTNIMALLPAGSVTGAPKKATLKIIEEAENYNRSYYTGIFGIYDGIDVSAAVMIRFIEKEGDKMYYKSGGGITAYSDPRKEYEELLQKIYVPIY